MLKKQVMDTYLKVMRKDNNTEYLEIKNLINEKKLLKFQDNALRNLLLHAYKNVPYYTHILDEIDIVKNSNIDSLSKFSNIPILTKDIIRKNLQTLISKDYKKRGWYYNSSGGSTGEPLRFIQDVSNKKWYTATWRYYQDINGINHNNSKNILIWASNQGIFKVSLNIRERAQNWLTNTKLLNSFKMSEEDMEKYIKIINSYKPEFITGYAGSLYELCLYAKKRKKNLFTPKIVISAAETLRDDMREEIESLFGTKLYDFYGSRETASLAGECRDGLMHIFTFNHYVEIVDKNNQPVKEGKEGRVIVTDLHNYSMPFIRYEIGDTAILGPKTCTCGNLLPTLKKITGRITDNFVRENGDIISGSALTLTFNLIDWVEAFQIIQEDFKKVKILIIKKNNINISDKRKIERKLKVLLGKDCRIEWEFVDYIPKAKSGKHLYIISKIQ